MTKRGKKVGGGIPLQLQRELDYLMVEVNGGFSRVTDRREVVTTGVFFDLLVGLLLAF